MLTRKDFLLRGEWDRPNYGDLTPRYFYRVIHKKTGAQIGGRFSSKKAAYANLGKVIKIANGLKSGKYVIEEGKIKRVSVKTEKEDKK
ncbi:MAG: hypothetical protein J6V08_02765 [Candidatus Methanomethylophilaceae archaeon]|nr:hypothetical protein [Candidatus Methanomethylophilaceae archaeon]